MLANRVPDGVRWADDLVRHHTAIVRIPGARSEKQNSSRRRSAQTAVAGQATWSMTSLLREPADSTPKSWWKMMATAPSAPPSRGAEPQPGFIILRSDSRLDRVRLPVRVALPASGFYPLDRPRRGWRSQLGSSVPTFYRLRTSRLLSSRFRRR